MSESDVSTKKMSSMGSTGYTLRQRTLSVITAICYLESHAEEPSTDSQIAKRMSDMLRLVVYNTVVRPKPIRSNISQMLKDIDDAMTILDTCDGDDDEITGSKRLDDSFMVSDDADDTSGITRSGNMFMIPDDDFEFVKSVRYSKTIPYAEKKMLITSHFMDRISIDDDDMKFISSIKSDMSIKIATKLLKVYNYCIEKYKKDDKDDYITACFIVAFMDIIYIRDNLVEKDDSAGVEESKSSGDSSVSKPLLDDDGDEDESAGVKEPKSSGDSSVSKPLLYDDDDDEDESAGVEESKSAV